MGLHWRGLMVSRMVRNCMVKIILYLASIRAKMFRYISDRDTSAHLRGPVLGDQLISSQ